MGATPATSGGRPVRVPVRVRSERETARITDPANPSSVPNPFGDKSEIRFPEYREPAWLVGSEDGVRQAISTPPGELAESVPELTQWAPKGLDNPRLKLRC